MRTLIQTPDILSPGDLENGLSAPTPGTATVDRSEQDKESHIRERTLNIRESRKGEYGESCEKISDF
jgi:hypothetical protein